MPTDALLPSGSEVTQLLLPKIVVVVVVVEEMGEEMAGEMAQWWLHLPMVQLHAWW